MGDVDGGDGVELWLVTYRRVRGKHLGAIETFQKMDGVALSWCCSQQIAVARCCFVLVY